MPTSSEWSVFHNLVGSKTDNFESMCNQLVWLHYSRYGLFKARANQPGIEFDLRLSTDCPLGTQGDHLGWQCKHHERNSNNTLTAAARTDIQDSLGKTEKYYPGLTKWVLWTPKPLAKTDQDWYYGLSSQFTLELWDDQRLETLLQDEGSILRKSYFGTLAANPRDLKELHERSVLPIRNRWLHPAHQNTDSENRIRMMLGDPEVLFSLEEHKARLREGIQYLEQVAYEETLEPTKSMFVRALMATDQLLAEVLENDQRRTLPEITSLLDDYSGATREGHERFIFLLRRENHPDSLQMTNLIQDIRESVELIKRVRDHLTKPFVALIGSAGSGKTHLSAEIAGPTDSRSAGVLLHGKWLRLGGDLDQLAKKLKIRSHTVDSFYELLALLDATAKRQKTRLPCIIDGLNEAENPKAWKDLLDQLLVDLRNFQNVLVVVTLRTVEHRNPDHWYRSAQRSEEFAEMALPEGCDRIEGRGFDSETEEAIAKYFKYYNIESKNRPPITFFSHPLNLRIFCETINPNREEKVIIENFPRSIRSLFSKYVWASCERIAQFENLPRQFVAKDIETSLETLAALIWEGGDRQVSEESFLDSISDGSLSWHNRRSFLLCQEGLTFREIDNDSGKPKILFAYDRLAGHVIATHLIQEKTTHSDLSWFQSNEFLEKMSGQNNGGHALSWDIFVSLCALLPELRNGKMFWNVAHTDLQSQALVLTPRIESRYIDEETLEALVDEFQKNEPFRSEALNELLKTLTFVSHPLNANFLSRCLESLEVVQRDIYWTEWIKGEHSYENRPLEQGRRLLKRWQKGKIYDRESEELIARFLMWHLTLTHRLARNTVTEALYWYGRRFPESLFELTLESLRYNDPYVTERMLAAAFGTTTALIGQQVEKHAAAISKFAEQLFSDFFSEDAQHYTTHFLARTYAQGVIGATTAAGLLQLSVEQSQLCKHPFGNRKHLDWEEELNVNKETSWEEGSPLEMDFENYTIGRIVKDRANYDFTHEQYRAVRAKIIWRAGDLGWKHPELAPIDSRVSERGSGYRWDYARVGKTDPYKRKYSNIGFQEMAGVQLDQDEIELYDRSRFHEIDIDPCFPSSNASAPPFKDSPLATDRLETKEWLQDDPLERAEELLTIPFGEDEWVLLDGRISEKDGARRRYSTLSFRSLFLEEKDLAEISNALLESERQGRLFPKAPEYYYFFQGEFYWNQNIPVVDDEALHIEVGHEDVEEDEDILVYSLNGEELIITPMELSRIQFFRDNAPEGLIDALEEQEPEVRTRKVMRRRPVEKACRFERPVGSYILEGKESSKLSSVYGPILDPRIACLHDLQPKPQTFDLFKDGSEAFKTFRRKEQFPKESTEVYSYLRKDFLREYLSNRGLVAISLLKSYRSANFGEPNSRQLSGKLSEQERGEYIRVVRLL